MGSIDAPERPHAAREDSRRSPISHRLKISAAFFGVIMGAYVSQKLQEPVGLDGDDETLLFWMFFLSVMGLAGGLLLGVVVLARTVRRAARKQKRSRGSAHRH